jgi:hypothetical protein
VLETQIREHCGLIDVAGDLLGPSLRGDVLSASERRAAALLGQAQQVVGDERYGPSGAFLPRRVGGRVDHDLADDSPARVMRVAAGDEKARQRLGDASRSGFGGVVVEMAQCRADAAAVVNRSRELERRSPRLVGFVLDLSTVLVCHHA